MKTLQRISFCRFSVTYALFVLFSLVTVLFHGDRLLAAEQLIHEDVVSVNQETWSGGSISWTHTIPADILAQASRVEAIVGAHDIDYPECDADECEQDRLYVNGSEVGLLSGSNNSTHANPVTIPLAFFTAGENTYRVDNEEVAHNWWLRITNSTLKFYSNTEDGGDSVDEDPLVALKIEKFQDKSSILPGDMQGYRIKVSNSGDTRLTGVVVTDQLDSLLDFDSSESLFAYQLNNDQLSWSVGSLAPKESAEIRFNARVDGDALANISVSNKAEATANNLLEKVESNTVTAISSFVAVEPDGLRVTKRLNRREGRIGRILSYKVLIENISNGTVFDLVLEDILPVGFSLVSGTVLLDGQSFTDPRGSRRLLWNLATLAPSSRVEIRYQVIIGSNVRRGQNVNRAVASGIDGGGSNVQGEDSVIVMIGGGHIEVPAEIRAHVFLDQNSNGLQNADDPPLEGITVILSSGEKKMSSESGRVIFENILSGYYAVAIDPRNLPEYTSVAGDATQLIRVIEGERARVLLPVQQDVGPARLMGMVFFDRNQNATFDHGETWPEKVTLLFDKKLQTQGKKGQYVFTGLRSGRHQLTVQAGNTTVTKEIELTMGNNTIDIPLKFSGISLSVEGK